MNRNREKFDWKNDDLSELEVVSEQPKLLDPGVTEIPLAAKLDKELGGSRENKRKTFVYDEGCYSAPACRPGR